MKLDVEPLRGTREVFLRPSLVKPRKIGEAEKTIALGKIELEWSTVLQLGVVHENRLPHTTGLGPPLEGNALDGNVTVVFYIESRRFLIVVIHLDRQPRTSRRREAQTGSRARSGSRSERTRRRRALPYPHGVVAARGGLRKVINNSNPRLLAEARARADSGTAPPAETCSVTSSLGSPRA